MPRRLILVATSVCFVVGFSNISSGQETKTAKQTIGANTLSISTYVDVPDATEQCEPAECQWWKKLREAANDVQRSGGRKSLGKYVNLFAEGLEKSYRVPLKDRPAQLLVSGGPPFPVRSKIPRKNGVVELRVEIRTDGSVGDVMVIKSLDPELDRQSIEALQRKAIYLPAVKDRIFVSEIKTVKFGVWSQGGVGPKPPEMQ